MEAVPSVPDPRGSTERTQKRRRVGYLIPPVLPIAFDCGDDRLPCDLVTSLCEDTIDRFIAAFGQPPTLLAAAPGRVNFIGEHTDYNAGFVLPMAINRHVMAAGAPNGTSIAHVHTTHAASSVRIDLTRPLLPGEPRWANYLRGVIAGMRELEIRIDGFNAFLGSDLPAGAGLSSSAAVEVAIATLIEGLASAQLQPLEKALLCQRAEHQFASNPCGIMDQFTSVFGRKDHLLLIDCRSFEVRPVPWPSGALSLLVINSGVQHELASTEYAQRRRECESAAAALGVAHLRDATLKQLADSNLEGAILRRARHVISENARTLACANAFDAAAWSEIGQLMRSSHSSLRDDYEVSCAELDLLVEIADSAGASAGVHGARMTGGGFGGCVIVLVEPSKLDAARSHILSRYFARTGIRPNTFVTSPVDGACLAEPPRAASAGNRFP